MATRISTSFMFQKGLSAMLNQQAKVGKSQEQISYGKRILRPSDDSAGMAQVLGFNRAISTTEQYQTNIVRAGNRLEFEEGVLKGITDLLPRVIELTVQGGSSVATAGGRSAIALEVRQLQSSMLELANTRDSAGEFLFSGFKGDTQPFTLVAGNYTYNGDEGAREIQVSADRTIADSDNGFEIFMDVPTDAGPPRNAFQTLELIATALEANNDPSGYLNDLHELLQHMGQIRASVGARMNSLEDQRFINDDFILAMESNRSRIEDLDYAEAISKFNREQIALEAAQQSFAKLQGLNLFNFIQ